MKYIYIILLLSLTYANDDCTAPVCLDIANIDTDAGTLDIMMTNQPGCLLLSTGGGFDASFTDSTECADYGTGGNIWYDGHVGGFQLELSGVTITGASGGTASQNFAIVNSSADIVLGFDIMGGTIPPGTDLILIQVYLGLRFVFLILFQILHQSMLKKLIL